jgi:hypothetical protein
MRFRLPEWDIAMPDSLLAYWTAWNETSLQNVPTHLSKAVTENVEWNDPRDSLMGRTALEHLVLELRTSKPTYRFVLASEIDHQHGRLRYRWNMVNRNRVLMEGLDVATLCPHTGLIQRVDGFFGHPTQIGDQTRVPEWLRASCAALL